MADSLAALPGDRDRLNLALSLGISERRLLGWEPTETHRGYDRDGQQVPLAEAWEVVVTRDPEWDDTQRDRMLGLALYDSQVCGGPCGLHESVTGDPEHNHLTFDTTNCPTCAAIDRYRRILAAQDAEADKQLKDAAPGAPRPSDGRHVALRRMSDDEVASMRAPKAASATAVDARRQRAADRAQRRAQARAQAAAAAEQQTGGT